MAMIAPRSARPRNGGIAHDFDNPLVVVAALDLGSIGKLNQRHGGDACRRRAESRAERTTRNSLASVRYRSGAS